MHRMRRNASIWWHLRAKNREGNDIAYCFQAKDWEARPLPLAQTTLLLIKQHI